jgi:hypothetical protein
MRCNICQYVTLIDMNEEVLSEVLFEHGEYDTPAIAIGTSVLSFQLGLKQFDVVYDKREGKTVRFKVVDIELDLIKLPAVARVFLEPQRLIVGQHDIGEFV